MSACDTLHKLSLGVLPRVFRGEIHVFSTLEFHDGIFSGDIFFLKLVIVVFGIYLLDEVSDEGLQR